MNAHDLLTSRRTFLAGGAALSTAIAIPHIGAAQTAGPPAYLAAGRAQIIATADSDPSMVVNWTPQRAVEEMDRSGVATSMVSMGPGLSILSLSREGARKMARSCNEYAASLMRDYPGRFGTFATLPLPDVDGSLAEAVYALDVLKADGIGLLTSANGKYPGDPAFRPLYTELNRRKAVVFVHPNSPQCCATSVPAIPASLDEFMFDVTRAITNMLFDGTFATYPDIRFIFTHAGGTTASISARINGFGARHHEYDTANPNGVYYELKKLHYDIANSTNPPAMAALMNLVPASQILFGSDTPYVPSAATANGFDKMTLSDDVRLAINRGNALQLFPRLGG